MSSIIGCNQLWSLLYKMERDLLESKHNVVKQILVKIFIVNEKATTHSNELKLEKYLKERYIGRNWFAYWIMDEWNRLVES